MQNNFLDIIAKPLEFYVPKAQKEYYTQAWWQARSLSILSLLWLEFRHSIFPHQEDSLS